MAISTAKEQVWCASPDWSAGGMSEYSVPDGCTRIGVHRVSGPWRNRPGSLRYGEAHGVVRPDAEYRALLAERGYLVPYFRKSFWDRARFEERARAKGRI